MSQQTTAETTYIFDLIADDDPIIADEARQALDRGGKQAVQAFFDRVIVGNQGGVAAQMLRLALHRVNWDLVASHLRTMAAA